MATQREGVSETAQEEGAEQQREDEATQVVVCLTGAQARSVFSGSMAAKRPSLPILACGLVESLPDAPAPTLSTTNLTGWLTRPLGGGGGRFGGRALRVVIDLPNILLTLKGIPAKARVEVAFTMAQTVITAPGLRCALPHPFPVEEFPTNGLTRAGEEQRGEPVTWGTIEDVAAWREDVAFVARYCDSPKGNRPIFTGICLDASEEEAQQRLTLIGADSYRLGVARVASFVSALPARAVVKEEKPAEEHEEQEEDQGRNPWTLDPERHVIAPAPEFVMGAQVLTGQEPVTLAVAQDYLTLRQGDFLLVFNRIPGLFPGYRSVIEDAERATARFHLTLPLPTLHAAIASLPRGDGYVLKMDVEREGAREDFALTVLGEPDRTLHTHAHVVHLALPLAQEDGQEGACEMKALPQPGTVLMLRPNFMRDLGAPTRSGVLHLAWGWRWPAAGDGAGSPAPVRAWISPAQEEEGAVEEERLASWERATRVAVVMPMHRTR